MISGPLAPSSDPHAVLRSYLGGLLDDARARSRVRIHPLVQLHVLDVVVSFCRADAMPTDPMAVQWARAQSFDRHRRLRALRTLGDHALFVCGFFDAWVRSGMMPRSYYVEMGRRAYSQAAGLAPVMGPVYGGLSGAFIDVTGLLGDVAARMAWGRPTPDVRRPA